MKKIFKLLTALFLIPTLLLAQPHGGQVTIGGSPGMTAFTGHKLTFATQGPQDIQWLTNNTVRMELDGSTGVLSGASGGALSIAAVLSSATTYSTLTAAGANSQIIGLAGEALDADVTTAWPSAETVFYFTNDATVTRAGWIANQANGNGVNLFLAKTRATSLNANTIVGASDELGSIAFLGADGVNYERGALIMAVVDGTPGSDDLPTRLNFYTTADGAQDVNLRFSIDNAGNLISDGTSGGDFRLLAGGKMVLITDGLSSTLSADLTSIFGSGANTGFLNISGATGGITNGVVTGGADANGSEWMLMKTRAADGSGNTIVASGDDLGAIRFMGADGVDYAPGARIIGRVTATPGSDDMPTSLIFQTTPDGSATLTTALTLGSNQSATFTGAVTSSIATDIGWSVVDQTDNQACNTGCTSGCVFGMENATGTAITGIVSCAATTSDLCLCAGAS